MFIIQVMSLKQRGIRAEFLGSAQMNPTVQPKAESGQFDILFMTPEKACLMPTRYYLISTNLLIARISCDFIPPRNGLPRFFKVCNIFYPFS